MEKLLIFYQYNIRELVFKIFFRKIKIFLTDIALRVYLIVNCSLLIGRLVSAYYIFFNVIAFELESGQ